MSNSSSWSLGRIVWAAASSIWRRKPEPSRASHRMANSSSRFTGKAVQNATRVASQISHLRRRLGDGHEHPPLGEDGRDGVHPRAAVGPNGGEIHQAVP